MSYENTKTRAESGEVAQQSGEDRHSSRFIDRWRNLGALHDVQQSKLTD